MPLGIVHLVFVFYYDYLLHEPYYFFLYNFFLVFGMPYEVLPKTEKKT